MGLFSGISDIYDRVDRATTRAENKVGHKLLDIVVPKRDRKDAVKLAKFLDRFAGMMSSGAPNTESAPSFIHDSLQPYRDLKKKRSPWNIYAASVAPLSLLPFPKGTLSRHGPEAWKAEVGGVVKRSNTEEFPHYHYFPPGRENETHSTTRLETSMRPDSSYINWLGQDPAHPGNAIYDLLAPLLNRYEMEGAQIDASPINVKVAGTLLGQERRNPGQIHPHALQSSTELTDDFLFLLNEVAGAIKRGDPTSAEGAAAEIRQKIIDNKHTPREFQGGLLSGLRYKEHAREQRGELGPFALPSATAPTHLRRGPRGNEFDQILEKIMDDPDSFRRRSSGIVVPQRYAHDVPAGVGTTPFGEAADRVRSRMGQDEFENLDLSERERLIRNEMHVDRPRLETTPEIHGSLFAHEHQAASLHTAQEWNRMQRMDRIQAAERVRDGYPARWEDWQRLRDTVRQEYDRDNRAGDFYGLTDAEQRGLLDDHIYDQSVQQGTMHRPPTASEIDIGASNWWARDHPEVPFNTMSSADRDTIRQAWIRQEWPRHQSVNTATDAVMDAIGLGNGPSIRPEETLSDLGLSEGANASPSLREITRDAEDMHASGRRLQGSFEDFVSQRDEAAAHARAAVGDDGWRSMSPEQRDSLIRAQMDQNRRSARDSRARNVEAFEGLGDPPDITERAMRMARADPEYHTWTDQERRAAARRIRGQLAHADSGGFVTRETFQFEEARRAHDPGEWERMNNTQHRASMSRAQLGLPYRERDYEHLREEARRLDPRYSPEEFDALSPQRQRERVSRFLRRRESER